MVPLTLAYAIVRYRLMDVDILFRRGYAYTLATLCVLAAFYGIIFSVGSLVQKNFQDLGNTGLITVMLVAAFLFQPIRNWIQERLDMHFYRDRYDYRRTLVAFARELGSETDLDTMLASVSLDEPDEDTGTTPDVADATLNVEQQILRRERLAAIKKHVMTLPEKQRAAVLMHKYDGMDYRDIAGLLKLSESATKSLLFRAYETLRERLKDFI